MKQEHNCVLLFAHPVLKMSFRFLTFSFFENATVYNGKNGAYAVYMMKYRSKVIYYLIGNICMYIILSNSPWML